MKITTKQLDIEEETSYGTVPLGNYTSGTLNRGPISSNIIVNVEANDAAGKTDVIPTVSIECFIGNTATELLSIGTVALSPSAITDAFHIASPYRYFKLVGTTSSTDGFINISNAYEVG